LKIPNIGNGGRWDLFEKAANASRIPWNGSEGQKIKISSPYFIFGMARNRTISREFSGDESNGNPPFCQLPILIACRRVFFLFT
jgi:hypothetical protein